MKKLKFNLLFLLISMSLGFSYSQPTFIWGKQFGTGKEDAGQDIVCYPSGDLILAGTTSGIMADSSFGKSDGFIIKFDNYGNEIWKKQFGTPDKDRIWELEADISGDLYVAGNTNGKINGIKYGDQDIFIYKFNKNGKFLKSLILGTDSLDMINEIYIDNDYNLYISGNTKGIIGETNFGDRDFFMMKMDSNFNKIFVYQYGTEKMDHVNDFIVDKNSDIYICGFTSGDLGYKNYGNTDAFFAKYSKDGKLIKIKQFGTEQFENVANILIDTHDNLYISGTSHGNIVSENLGKSDVYIMKLDKNWGIIWQEQYGTSSWDEAWYMELVNSENNLMISGSHNPDAYIRLYDSNGNLKWDHVFAAKGKNAGTGGRHFKVFENKYIYFTGFTFADLFSKNPNQKEGDVYILKLGFIE